MSYDETVDTTPVIEFGAPPQTLIITGQDGKPLVTIHLDDGHIDYGHGYSPDEAAKIFWQALSHHIPR